MHCRRPRHRRPLEWKLDVDECGKCLAGVRVLRDFKEVPLTRLVLWVPDKNVKLRGAGAGFADADARAGAGGGGAGGGLSVRAEEGRGCAGVVIHGRSPGWPRERERGGGLSLGWVGIRGEETVALESEVSALRSRVIFLLLVRV